MEKQITRVFEAVLAGCETSDQVSNYTGLPLKHCSSYLSELAADGLIILRARKGRTRSMHMYGPIA